jgi:hypothetical protein
VTSLRELQEDVRRALLGQGDDAAAAAVVEDGLTAAGRLAIYRHHVFTTLTAALQATFPVVCRLVDERFFAYAAHHYIREHPPAGPCLFEYGATFAAFLAGFPPCRALPYLADVARLEWAMNAALHAPDQAPLKHAALEGLARQVTGEEIFSLDPSLALIASPWPIHAIWRANQPEADATAAIDLGAGGVWLQVRRLGDDVGFRALDRGTFVFRQALAEGRRLADAVEEVMAVDARFDLAQAFAALVREDLVTSIARPLERAAEPA